MTAGDIQCEGMLGCETESGRCLGAAPSAQTEPWGGGYLGRQRNRGQVHENGAASEWKSTRGRLAGPTKGSAADFGSDCCWANRRRSGVNALLLFGVEELSEPATARHLAQIDLAFPLELA